MQVKHNADELAEGETVILTLADRNILDDKGDLDDDADELENALVVRVPSSTALAPSFFLCAGRCFSFTELPSNACP